MKKAVKRSRTRGLWIGLVCLGWFLVGGGVSQAAPGVGDPAPDFSLMGTDGRIHSLSDYRGRKAVVLAWFPKAFTPG
jgi:peroxiredoxin Q/BCP